MISIYSNMDITFRLDECGNWDPDDHFIFVAIHDQYPRELPNRRTLLFDRLKRHLPSKYRIELVLMLAL